MTAVGIGVPEAEFAIRDLSQVRVETTAGDLVVSFLDL
jgi:hypothetical protein